MALDYSQAIQPVFIKTFHSGDPDFSCSTSSKVIRTCNLGTTNVCTKFLPIHQVNVNWIIQRFDLLVALYESKGINIIINHKNNTNLI